MRVMLDVKNLSYWLLGVSLLLAGSATAQQLPKKKDVLKKMTLANAYFMKQWPDPGKEIMTNKLRPSHIWTRGVYYEGLMALYGLDKKKQYYNYAVDWGQKRRHRPQRR
jgi:unsaturated rhamnogalacturonyl hydrolase